MNKVILMGRLTAKPELQHTAHEIAMCRFTIAVDRGFTNKQTGAREADFISCTAWRKTAEFISRYFQKGQMICVEGNLRNNKYPDKKYSDVMHYVLDVVVENANFCGGKAEQEPLPTNQEFDNFTEILDDDALPF